MFSSKEHTKALDAKDVWAVVGWSGDLAPAAERSSDLVLVAPASGTALWADVWAVPSHAQHGSRVSRPLRAPSPQLLGWPLRSSPPVLWSHRTWGFYAAGSLQCQWGQKLKVPMQAGML